MRKTVRIDNVRELSIDISLFNAVTIAHGVENRYRDVARVLRPSVNAHTNAESRTQLRVSFLTSITIIRRSTITGED